MSSRSRPLSSIASDSDATSTPDRISSAHFKTYSFSHGDQQECMFDEDEDIKTRYLEKEQTFKRINEELEKKSSEIFEKIEKFRYHENPSTRSVAHEMGQGDSYSNVPEKVQDIYEESAPNQEDKSLNTIDWRNLFRPYSSRSYFDYAGTFEDGDNTYISQRNNKDQDNTESRLNFSKRPSTAHAVISSFSNTPSSSKYHTEVSLRRVETAKPAEGLEEKHQARLQKATESVLKCVQSKLVNYEQRLADMHLQYRQKIQENTMLEGKITAMEEDRRRLLKTVYTLQSTTEKVSKSAESSKMNLTLKTQAFASLKKELDGLKKELKQKNCMIQSLQTRLDRCTEENRRLKSQNQSTQLNMKQMHNEDKASIEELKQRITQLEHQKSSFQATVEKQALLIKNLRSHKVGLTDIIKKHKIDIKELENEEEDKED